MWNWCAYAAPFGVSQYHTEMESKTNRFDYDRAAPDYDRHRQGRGPYFPALLRLASACPPGRVLEVGAGTGNNTEAILADTGRTVVALEPSAGMLRVGRGKVPAATWGRGRVEALPFQADSFAFLFGTYMLHYIADLDAAFGACHRVLAPGGCAAFVTVSHEFIRAHPMNAYFPSFAAVDCGRFPALDEVQSAMRRCGFIQEGIQTTCAPPRAVDLDYAEKIANHFISTYALLPEDEFCEGLARLHDDIATHGGQLPVSIVREAVIVYGWKRGLQ